MRLGIIGCGNMGSAIIKGMLSKKILSFSGIYASDKDAQKTKVLYRQFGIRVCTNEELVNKCQFIFIAVKPQDAKNLLRSISGFLDNNKHLISIMAGVSIAKVESIIGKKLAISRAMPNMAAVVGKSVTCVTHNKMVKNKTFVQQVFSSIGEVIEIEEKHMDAVTAISGSGPAYFFYLTECLFEAARKLGIKKDKALELAVAVLIGSGTLIDNLKLAPEVLRKKITSKKGTTEAAISILKSKKFKKIIELAAKKAAKRSKDLSKGV